MSEPNLTSLPGSSDAAADANGSRPAKLKWTEDETQALVEGCNKHGVGSWTQILSDSELMPRFSDRTPGDLKDRFRTYFPDSYHELYPNAKTHWGNQSRGKAPDGRSIFEKGKVKERRPFTEEEDRALMRGYKMYGSHWALIARDPAFKNQRRSTDVRDRFRNAFPEEYARAGYKPRSKAKSKSAAKNKAAANGKDANVFATPNAIPNPMQFMGQGVTSQSMAFLTNMTMAVAESPAPSLSSDSAASSLLFDPRMHASSMNPDFGFLQSQALLSPEMFHAAIQGVPFDRSNVLQWYSPALPNATPSDDAPNGNSAGGSASSHQGSLLTQPVQRSQSTHGAQRPGYQRTRTMTYARDPHMGMYASSYPNDSHVPFDQTWNLYNGDFTLNRGTNNSNDNFSLFPALPTFQSSDGNTSMSSNGSNMNDSFLFPSATYASSDSASALFAAAGVPNPSMLTAPALSSFAQAPPSHDTQPKAEPPSGQTASHEPPAQGASNTGDTKSASAQRDAEAFLQMAFTQATGLPAGTATDPAIPSSGLECSTMMQPSFSGHFAPFLTANPHEGTSLNTSPSLEKNAVFPQTDTQQ
ncbi:hypothetical protein CBS14141_001333 [Malassezia furfur]|nr:hypothetical protein CBS14141_001333 [Malassezia furfur]